MPKGDQNLDEWLNEVSQGTDDRLASPQHSHSSSSSSFLVAIIALVLVAGGAIAGYTFRQQSAAKQTASHNTDLNGTIAQLRTELDAVTAKLNSISAAQVQPAADQPTVEAVAPEPVGPASVRRHANRASANRYNRLQAPFGSQPNELKDTQGSVTQKSADVHHSVSSAKGVASGSIAKNRDESVALEKRGERDYFEFDLTKNKQFQRTGPISISLRRTDAKHMSYDAIIRMDDNQLTKKHVDLYEPIWFDRPDDPQPLELVVNKMDKNHVHGYVSVPTYRNSELATNSGSSAPQDASGSSHFEAGLSPAVSAGQASPMHGHQNGDAPLHESQ
jgi:hypothetical protein